MRGVPSRLELSENFIDLHIRVYEEMVVDRKFDVDNVRPIIQLACNIYKTNAHSVLTGELSAERHLYGDGYAATKIVQLLRAL